MSDSALERKRLVVAAPDAGTRLDRYLSGNIDNMSRERLKAIVRQGHVTVDGTPVSDPSHKVRVDNVIDVTVPAPSDMALVGEAMALAIVHEDDEVIVIDKPAGLVVHPGPGNETGTLVHALIAHCGEHLSGIGGVRRPGIVHRLDKDTSGLLVVAKTDAAHHGLSAQFQAHGADGRLRREYLAFVWGTFERPAGSIDAPLARSPANRRKMAIARPGTGRRAVTHYCVEASYRSPAGGEVSRLRLRLETGRTHQIRVHLASLGHPLLGDRVYGTGFRASEKLLSDPARIALERLGRQALHAALLGFEHPISGDRMIFESPLPPDLEALQAALVSF